MSQLDLLRPWGQESWGGFGTLRREMDELFDRFGAFPPVLTRSAFPAVNLYETEEAYLLTAALTLGLLAGLVNATASANPATAQNDEIAHTVQEGDTLEGLA